MWSPSVEILNPCEATAESVARELAAERERAAAKTKKQSKLVRTLLAKIGGKA